MIGSQAMRLWNLSSSLIDSKRMRPWRESSTYQLKYMVFCREKVVVGAKLE